MNILWNFILFIFKPIKEKYNLNKTNKILSTILLVVFNIAVSLIINFLKFCFIKYSMTPKFQNGFQLNSVFKLYVFPIFIGPLIEEVMFRLWIVYSPLNFALSISLIISIIILLFCYNEFIFENGFHTAYSFLFGIAIFPPLFIIIRKLGYIFKFNWGTTNRPMVIVSGIIFGIWHIFNYVINYKSVFYSPILLAPLIISGLTFGYIRLRIGFAYGYAAHSLQNAFVTLISVLK